MNDAPYRGMISDSQALNWERGDKLDRADHSLLAKFDLPLGARILMAGLPAQKVLSNVKSQIGRDGQLLVSTERLEALTDLSEGGCDWLLPLKAQAHKLPLTDCFLEVIVCWGSFLGFEDKAAAVKEFFRVLRPEGTVFVAQSGPGLPRGLPRPCPRGLTKIFLNNGFQNFNFDTSEESYLFRAQKASGYFMPRPCSA